MRIQLIHAYGCPGGFAYLLWRDPYWGIEIRVWKCHWLWIGYTEKAARERGW